MAVGREAAQLVVVRVVEQQAREVVLRLVRRDAARLQIPLVVGAQQLVELAARAVAVVLAGGGVEPADPLAGLAQRAGRALDQVLVDLAHLTQVLAQHGMALGLDGLVDGLDRPAHPDLDAVDGLFLRVVEVVVAVVARAVVRELLEQPAPAQGEADGVVAAEVRVRADAGDDAVLLLLGLQVVVVQVRVELDGPRPGHAVHPAVGKGVAGVDEHGMLGHHVVEVLAPPVVAHEGAGRVVEDGFKVVVSRSASSLAMMAP